MKKKIRFILDPSVPHSTLRKIPKVTNLVTMEEIGLQNYVEDEQILSAGQRENRIILTSNAGKGFSVEIVTKPDYNNTGVVIVPSKLDQTQFENAVIKLVKNIQPDDLTHARTTVDPKKAKIEKGKSQKEEIYFNVT